VPPERRRRSEATVATATEDALVDQLDELRLVVDGAKRIALAGEFSDEPALAVIEVAAVLGLVTDELGRILKRLDPARDQ
jgi:hypothetical protein